MWVIVAFPHRAPKSVGVKGRAVLNTLFLFYSGRIVYSHSANDTAKVDRIRITRVRLKEWRCAMRAIKTISARSSHISSQWHAPQMNMQLGVTCLQQ